MSLLLIWACSDADIFEPVAEMGTVVEILNEDAKNDIFMVVDEQATFPEGPVAWSKFLKANLNYPEQAKRLGVQGAVYLSFTVEKDGAINDVMISRGIGAGCDEEAVKALLASPKWIPAKLNGEVVKSKMAIRIVFKDGNQPAVNESTESIKKDFIEVPVQEKMAPVTEASSFPGGTTAWFKYLRSNLSFPAQAKRMGVEGAVYVNFAVSAEGEISDVLVSKGIGAGCDEEAVRVMKNSPKWTPAKGLEGNVASRQAIRIVFKQS